MNERNKKRVRVRVREKMKTPKERKNREKYNNSWEIDKRDFSRIFIFILASDKTSKNVIIIKTITITITIILFILMKSSYHTYQNNQIEE